MTEARLETLETTVRGRYWVSEGLMGDRAPVLVGFHGYGEDAPTHLRELNLIPGVTAWKRIAIQGLHPFYNTRTGDVVASWMTKLDREAAIRNNLRYVRRALERELNDARAQAPLVYTGFSQGTAMAYRAAAGLDRACQAVIALGGDVPPELADGALSDLAVALVGRGSRDEWYTEEKFQRDLEVLRSQGVDARPVRFEGGHEWTDAFRSSAGRLLEGLLPPIEA